MTTRTWIAAVAALGLSAALGQAQVASLADATGQCNDGTFTQAKLKSEACGQHGGVKGWFGSVTPSSETDPKGSTEAALTPAGGPAPLADPAQPAPAAGPRSAASSPAGAASPGPAVVPVSGSAIAASARIGPPPASPPATAAAPASPPAGAYDSAAAAVSQTPADRSPLVWVNTGTRVYHCAGTEWYGKTARGTYMSESNAVLLGIHASHDTACPK